LENYAYVYKWYLFPSISNSIIIASGTVVLSLILGSMAAYGFSRGRFKRKDNMMLFILSTRMMPPIAVALPFFLLFKTVHLLDNHISVMLVHSIANIAFVVWVMKGFFDEVPVEIEEAAFIDGCSRFRTLTRIVFPLTAPGMVVTAIFTFVFSWSEFCFAYVLTRSRATTLPVQMLALQSIRGAEWGRISAFSIMGVAVIFVLALSLQKYLVRGLTFGAVKG